MRKPVLFALAAVALVLAVTTIFLYAKVRKTTAEYAQLQVTEQDMQQRYGRTLDAIAEIQDSLNAITMGDPAVPMEDGGLETERSLGGADGRKALDRIALLRAGIQRSKQRIRGLESMLQANGIKLRGMEKLIARLKDTVREKETLVASLSANVDSLSTQVTGLTTQVAQTQDTLQIRNQEIEEKRRELATVYYVVGSPKELRNWGLVEARGGVLGVGRSLQPTGNFDASFFVPLDTDQQNVIRIPAAKAKVLSAQPPSSYVLRPSEQGLELHIVDPQAFRKVRQLVIVSA